MVRKKEFLATCLGMKELGNLPREDTYMTTVMNGMFTSKAQCLHYEHASQVDRGNWGKSMFYRIHEAIVRDPEAFLKFMGKFEHGGPEDLRVREDESVQVPGGDLRVGEPGEVRLGTAYAEEVNF
jgi:hypothetical protein